MDNDDMLLSVKPEDFERVWKIFVEFNQTERHHNEIIIRYRSLSSTWILAAFIGIGFVVSKESIGLPIDRLLIIMGICIAGCIGNTLVWYLDLIVYGRFLGANYYEGLELERKYPWLPRVRTNIRKLFRKKLRQKLAWFYIAGNSILLIMAAVAFMLWLRVLGGTDIWLASCAGGLIFLIIGIVMYILAITGRDDFHKLGDKSTES